jgi:L-ascorbate metabolism protein UlaG (beta-lactamase superfamily)
MVKVTYHGHSCVEFAGEAGCVIVDPFLSDNPLATSKPEDIDVDAVLLTHVHSDHLGDAIDIAKRLDVPIVGTHEVVTYCKDKHGVDGHPMHIGGQHRFDFARVRLTVAQHGSYAPEGYGLGPACGIVIDFDPTTVYHAGDTGLTLDMKLLNEVIENIDLACLPIGGNYTMDVADAVLAAEFINPRIAMPIHYNTWPVIEADPKDFAKRVECDALVLEPGESADVE